MYGWYICHNLVGAEMEAELLIKLLTSGTIILQGSPNSFDKVRWLDCRCGVWLDKADLHFCCEGCGVFLSMKGVIHVSMDYYNTAWSWHLEF